MNLLENKVALVTGGSRGIGNAICGIFADHGANVIMNYSSEVDKGFHVDEERVEEHCRDSGTEFVAYDLDISRIEEHKKMIDFIMEKFGRLNILVNNSSFSPFISLEETNPEIWNRVIATNLTAPFFLSKLVANVMGKNDKYEGIRGSIINISSISAGRGGNSHAYCASKSALESITKTLAMEFAPSGIKVNAIAPGLIDTDLSRKSLENAPPEQLVKLYRSIPFGRAGKPWEVARTAVYLASDDSNYVTGSVLQVNGGWHIPISGDEVESR